MSAPHPPEGAGSVTTEPLEFTISYTFCFPASVTYTFPWESTAIPETLTHPPEGAFSVTTEPLDFTISYTCEMLEQTKCTSPGTDTATDHNTPRSPEGLHGMGTAVVYEKGRVLNIPVYPASATYKFP